jgi:hypothetical protein
MRQVFHHPNLFAVIRLLHLNAAADRRFLQIGCAAYASTASFWRLWRRPPGGWAGEIAWSGEFGDRQ